MRTGRKRPGAEPRAGFPTYCDKKEHPLNYTGGKCKANHASVKVWALKFRDRRFC